MTLTLNAPWLELDLGAEMQVLSWAVHNPGPVTARRILWREVRNADLPPGMDVGAWLATQLSERGQSDAVCFLTSRNITRHHDVTATVEGVTARAVATVGLSNAERVGHRTDYSGRNWGTINVAVQVSLALTPVAMLEAMSIASQARTAAVMDTGAILPEGIATGTGTDCIAVAAPLGDAPYAGLHTPLGEALGRAVYDAVLAGALEWRRDYPQAPGIPMPGV